MNNFSSAVTTAKMCDTNASLVSLCICDKKMFNFSHWKPNNPDFLPFLC